MKKVVSLAIFFQILIFLKASIFNNTHISFSVDVILLLVTRSHVMVILSIVTYMVTTVALGSNLELFGVFFTLDYDRFK